MRRRGLFIVLALFACDSGGPGLSPVEGSGFFSPSTLDFGTRTIGQRHELTTILTNSSADNLRVENVRFDPVTDVFQARRIDGTALRGTLLLPGRSVEIEVRYSPIDEADYDATMIVESEELAVPLELTARARRVAPARPVLNPTRIDFSNIEVGRDASEVVTIENGGETDGALEDIRGERGPFRVTDIDGQPLRLPSATLAPGESIQVEVHFRPSSMDPTGATLAFELDTEEVATLTVTGDAVAPGEMTCEQTLLDYGEVPRGQIERRPVRCSVAGDGPYTLREIRVVPGSASGFTIPNVPTALDGTRSIEFEVVFDASGLPRRYDGALEIEAEHGGITRVPIVAVTTPPLPGTTDLTVNIEWNTARSDIDLHVVRAGGLPFMSGDDCYFADKNPDWGVVNDEADDPFLDFDDVDGLGPEEVNLSRAAETSYDVYLHYFGFHGGPLPPSTTVDVRYRIRGGPETIVSQQLNECGRAVHVGTFMFDSGTPRFVPVGMYTDAYRPFAIEACQ
ncbi:MAG: choice-of-anchor D domain-containing protein [Deltaproteobacteria bacterium]